MCSGKTHFIQNKLYLNNYYDYQALIPLPIESLAGEGCKFDVLTTAQQRQLGNKFWWNLQPLPP